MKSITTKDGTELLIIETPIITHEMKVHGFGSNNNLLYYDETGWAYNHKFDFNVSILGEITRDNGNNIVIIPENESLRLSIVEDLESNGILFKNPIKPFYSGHQYESEYQAELKEWEEYEKQVLPLDKKLIILKKE